MAKNREKERAAARRAADRAAKAAAQQRAAQQRAAAQQAYLAGGPVPTDFKMVPARDKNGNIRRDKNGAIVYRRQQVTIPGAKELGPRPSLVGNIDPAAIGRGATAEGQRTLGEMMGSYGGVFDTLAAQQRGQIDALAGRLDNQYTADARNAIGASMTDAQNMSGLGQSLANQSAYGFQTSGPTEIEQELYRQGQSELALGRSLSPEQLRDATQSARQAFSARGLGTGMGAASAELLNRDRYATEREAQRRQFAAGANQMREDNVMARRDAAGRLGALGGGLMGEAGTMRQRGGAMMTDIDPYQRALNPGLALGQSAQQYGLNTAGNQFGSALQLFGNTSTFNVNRGDNMLTNWMNNAAAIRGANTQAQATRDASKRGFMDYATDIFKSVF
jgi:hypothetical protein